MSFQALFKHNRSTESTHENWTYIDLHCNMERKRVKQLSGGCRKRSTLVRIKIHAHRASDGYGKLNYRSVSKNHTSMVHTARIYKFKRWAKKYCNNQRFSRLKIGGIIGKHNAYKLGKFQRLQHFHFKRYLKLPTPTPNQIWAIVGQKLTLKKKSQKF